MGRAALAWAGSGVVRLRVARASHVVMVGPASPRSLAEKESSSIKRSTIVCSRRAPMLSTCDAARGARTPANGGARLERWEGRG
eukprot:2065065-Prymnesium_polylepis.3